MCFFVIACFIARPALPLPTRHKARWSSLAARCVSANKKFGSGWSNWPAGPGAKIAVFPTASINPLRSAARASEALQAAGGYPFMVPVALEKIDIDYHKAVEDPALVSQVREAGAVFFTGGEQSRIMQALVGSDGKNTPMLDAVWDVYRRGGAIVGTSAGAAVMSHIMYRDARNVLDTLQKGVSMGNEIANGLGFLDPGWFVEQHSLARGPIRPGAGGHAIATTEVRHRRGRKHGLGGDRRHAK